MSRLRDTAQDYLTALKTQRDRLAVADWLKEQAADETVCPICNGPMHGANKELDELLAAIASVDAEAKQFKPAPDAFEKEFHSTRELIRVATEKLNGVRARKKGLSDKSDDVRRTLYRAMEIDRFLGRLEQALETYDSLAPGSDLVGDVAELSARIKALVAKVAENDVRKRESAALSKVSAFAARLIPQLDAERPDDAIVLSIKDLAIRVQGTERDDYLFEIGSGANWLSYHVAVILGLQQLFVSQEHSPVPGFVVFDQPSQVYFPRRLATRKDEAAEGKDVEPKLEDEDAAAVRRVFKVLGDVAVAAKGALQFIVLDHADDNVWGGLDGVVAGEEWREGKKLVPIAWLT